MINNNSPRLSLYYTNACSLQRKRRRLNQEARGAKILSVTESWYKNSQSQEDREIEGYAPPLTNNRPGDRNGGGVALYYKPDIIVKRLPEYEEDGLELLWAKIK